MSAPQPIDQATCRSCLSLGGRNCSQSLDECARVRSLVTDALRAVDPLELADVAGYAPEAGLIGGRMLNGRSVAADDLRAVFAVPYELGDVSWSDLERLAAIVTD